jgi:hypothetical protein
LQENTRAVAVLRIKAAACGLCGRIEEGHECVGRLRELAPGSTVAGAIALLHAPPEVRALYLDGLRKAGLLEE